jgi:hypothetical protein
MSELVRELRAREIVSEASIFILNRLLAGVDIKRHPNLLGLISMYSKVDDKEIAEAYWEKRKIIAKQKDSAYKLALCIYCDLHINRHQGGDQELLRLITTMVIKQS